LFVVAGLSLISALSTVVVLVTGGTAEQMAESRKQIEDDPKLNQMDKDFALDLLVKYEQALNVLLPVDAVIVFLGGLLIANGARHLLTLKSRGWARAGSILAMIPCFACCLVGLPIGIWALTVIHRTEVTAAFASVQRTERRQSRDGETNPYLDDDEGL
jgi:hypothetical protein